MTTGDHWRPLATSGAGARYGRSYASAGTTTLLEHPIRLRRTKVEYGCLLRRLWRRMIVSEFGVCPPRASTGGAGPPYALIHASRYDTPGAPNSPPQVRGRTWIPSVQASGEGDGPGIWSMPPYTAWAAPPRQRRASNDDANARATAFSAAIRDGTGSAVGDADGAPGWGRFPSTRFTDANGSSTTEQNI